MTVDDEGAGTVRDRLDRLADSAPPVHFRADDVVRLGRRRRRLHRGAMATGAAAALALVVAVPAVALRGDGTGTETAVPGPTPVGTGLVPTPLASSPAAAGPATPTPAPSSPVATSPAPGTNPPGNGLVPGLTPAEANRIARGCARSFAGANGPVDPTPPVGSTAGPRLEDLAGVYGLVRDAVGSHALVYAAGAYLSCDFGGSPVQYNAGGASGGESVTEWLPGVLAVDGSTAAEGGLPRKGVTGGPGSPGYYLAEGRVTSAVARLVVTIGTDRAELRPLNRTFLVRFVHSGSWKPAAADHLVIEAYDAGGRLLTRYDQARPQPCYRTPSGEAISGGRPPGPDCLPALPWN